MSGELQSKQFRFPVTAKETADMVEAHKAKITIKRRRKKDGNYESQFRCTAGHPHRNMLQATMCEAKRS